MAASDRSLPAGPRLPPVLQTLRWLLRPISFLESCRRGFGDAFSVRFLGFETPMVMLSDPEAIRALYTRPRARAAARAHARAAADHGPAVGAAARGARAPGAAAADAAAVPRRAHAGVRVDRARGRRARGRALARRRAVRAPSADAARHARGDPARGLRRHRPGPPGAAGRAPGRLLDGHRFRRPAVRRPALAPPRCAGPARAAWRRSDGRSTRCWTSRSPSAAPTRARTSSRMLVAARFEDGEPMDDAEIRDQLITLLLAGHETTATGLAWTFDLLLRHPDVLARLLAEIDAGSDDAYLRAVVAESLRLRPVVPLAGRRLASELTRRRSRPAARHRRHAGDLAHAHARPTATPSRSRSAPSGSSRARRRPTRGSRSAAACGAASARRSPRWRCASRSRRSCAGAC